MKIGWVNPKGVALGIPLAVQGKDNGQPRGEEG
jgi:hypothetical protein